MAGTPKTIFLNADYIVVEYIDIIKSPYFSLLQVLRQNERLKEILKIEEIEHLSLPALYEWYMYRKHINPFVELNRYPDKISEEALNIILDDQMGITEEFVKRAPQLLLLQMIKTAKKDKLAGDVLIYLPHKNTGAEKDLEALTGFHYPFYYDFNEVVEKAKFNSTYFLSDIKKIYTIRDLGYLRMSSISIPYDYRYNKKNMTEMDLDFKTLFKENPFKLSYFYAASKPEK